MNALEETTRTAILNLINSQDFDLDNNAKKYIEDRIRSLEFKSQFKILGTLFSKITDLEHQTWLLETTSKSLKSNVKNYKSGSTMVDFFIKQYSYGELESLRTSIWTFIK